MKKLSLIFLLFAFQFTYGEEIKIEKAKQVAINYLKNQNTIQLKSVSEITLTQVNDLFYNNADIKLKSAVIDSSGLFIFNVNENQGFIVISGNDVTIPVLAYGEEGKLEAGKVPDGLMFFLDSYKEQLQYLKKYPIKAPNIIKEEWSNLLSDNDLKSSSLNENDTIGPLLDIDSIKWDQRLPFNSALPFLDEARTQQPPVGCVATAMAQIMRFHKWPEKGFGYYSYFPEQFIGDIQNELSAIFGASNYDWDNMPGRYVDYTQQEKVAVSQLMLDVGISINMNYTLNGSGTFTSKIVRALEENFGYSQNIEYIERNLYSQESWEEILMNNLDLGLPVIYRGDDKIQKVAHAFICDGYIRNSSLFHFNWGWSGNGNCYCYVSDLIPKNRNDRNYNRNQAAVIGIRPNNFDYGNLRINQFSHSEFTFNEPATINVEIQNYSTQTDFLGTVYFALFKPDESASPFNHGDKHFIDIGTFNDFEIVKGNSRLITLNIPKVTLKPGDYKLAVFYKKDGFNGVSLDNGTSSNFAQIIIKSASYLADLQLTSSFSVSSNPVIINNNFSVTATFKNEGYYSFTGKVGLGIFDSNGLVRTIDEALIENLVKGYGTRNIVFETDKIDVLPGKYLFGIYQKKESGETDILAPIEYATKYVDVISPPVLADVYEFNDSPDEAFNLTYPENSTSLTVYGATIHDFYDIDFFRLNLPQGYNYRIKANVYDLNNPKLQSDLTCDVFLKYFINSNWTNEFDSHGEEVTTTNGGEILFLTIPKNEGLTGSYVLEIIIQREIKILGIEYFWDKKNGQNEFIASTNSSDETFNFNIPLNNIAPGLHRLYFRTKDSQGKWSTIYSKPVLVTTEQTNASINKIEYFLDEIPSEGTGNSLGLVPSKDVSVSKNLSLTNISPGLHRIYFKAQDEYGRWSTVHSKPVLVSAEEPDLPITNVEYFFDQENSVKGANSLSFVPSKNVEIFQNISLNNISTGLHRIYFKGQNESGIWSTVHSKPILVTADEPNPLITKIEYFFDKDPGINSGKSVMFTPGNDVTVVTNIPLDTLSSGTHSIFFRAKNSKGFWSYPQFSSFSIENVALNIPLQSGWNIFSTSIIPDSLDIRYISQSLISNNSLVKIQDEGGISLEDWGIFGSWKNNIGNISVTEGYKIKVNRNDTLEVSGTPVEYPYAIPLKTGWNIAGYPQLTDFSGMNLVQQLADKGTLIKVQDEEGNSIEDWGIFGSWKNNIGNFMAGEGYKIKVSANDTLWVYESYSKSSAVVPEIVATSYFKPVFNGNGIDHMNINLVGLPINILQVGDELAIFDGATCVGAVTLIPHHLHSQTVSIVTSATDNQGMPGFVAGNPFVLKLWNSENNQEFNLEPEIVKGTSTFTRNETTVVSLEKYATTGLEGLFASEQPEINCYPNPFSDEITVEINLFNETEVYIEVLNQLGQQVRYLAAGEQLNRGVHRLIWDGTNAGKSRVAPGIYLIRMKISDMVYYRKVVYSK